MTNHYPDILGQPVCWIVKSWLDGNKRRGFIRQLNDPELAYANHMAKCSLVLAPWLFAIGYLFFGFVMSASRPIHTHHWPSSHWLSLLNMPLDMVQNTWRTASTETMLFVSVVMWIVLSLHVLGKMGYGWVERQVQDAMREMGALDPNAKPGDLQMVHQSQMCYLLRTPQGHDYLRAVMRTQRPAPVHALKNN